MSKIQSLLYEKYIEDIEKYRSNERKPSYLLKNIKDCLDILRDDTLKMEYEARGERHFCGPLYIERYTNVFMHILCHDIDNRFYDYESMKELIDILIKKDYYKKSLIEVDEDNYCYMYTFIYRRYKSNSDMQCTYNFLHKHYNDKIEPIFKDATAQYVKYLNYWSSPINVNVNKEWINKYTN